MSGNRNQRIMDRYNELIRQPGAHGHYETIFRIVREEVDSAIDAAAEIADDPWTRKVARTQDLKETLKGAP
jgi:hypothetical protein